MPVQHEESHRRGRHSWHLKFLLVTVTLVLLLLLLHTSLVFTLVNSQAASTSHHYPSLVGSKPTFHRPLSYTYVWLHIPKTAGMLGYAAFMEPLLRANERVYPPPTFHSWNAPGCGHFAPYGASHCARSEILDCLENGTSASQQSFRFMSILRHPVDRVLSEYFWWKSKYELPWTQSMNDKDEVLETWILDESNVAHNRQARNLLMDVSFRFECAAYNASDSLAWTIQEYGSIRAFNEVDLGTDSEVDALLHGKLYFAAIFDDILLSRRVYNRLFGLQTNLTEQQETHTVHHRVVTEREQQLILDRNQLDLKLYEAAKRRLQSA